MRVLVSAATFAAMVLVVRWTSAGCENPCTIKMEPVTVEPPLACAIVEVRPQTCDCALLLELENFNCEAPVMTSGFAFASCGGAAGPEAECTVVAGGDSARLESPIQREGKLDLSYIVSDTAGEHTITVRAGVKMVDGCSLAAPGRAGSSCWAVGLLVLALVLRRRA